MMAMQPNKHVGWGLIKLLRFALITRLSFTFFFFQFRRFILSSMCFLNIDLTSKIPCQPSVLLHLSLFKIEKLCKATLASPAYWHCQFLSVFICEIIFTFVVIFIFSSSSFLKSPISKVIWKIIVQTKNIKWYIYFGLNKP